MWSLVFSRFTWLKDAPEEESCVRGAILHASVALWRGVNLELMRNKNRTLLSRQTEGFVPQKVRMICVEATVMASLEPERCIRITSFRDH